MVNQVPLDSSIQAWNNFGQSITGRPLPFAVAVRELRERYQAVIVMDEFGLPYAIRFLRQEDMVLFLLRYS